MYNCGTIESCGSAENKTRLRLARCTFVIQTNLATTSEVGHGPGKKLPKSAFLDGRNEFKRKLKWCYNIPVKRLQQFKNYNNAVLTSVLEKLINIVAGLMIIVAIILYLIK